MKLKLVRDTFTDKSTIGKLYINDKYECFTLEDTNREVFYNKENYWKSTFTKVEGNTCIPVGEYKVIINLSNRFKKEMPLLLDVPGYKGVRIHSGNVPADTLGCILVGTTKATDRIQQSAQAYKSLFTKLNLAYKNKESISIEIVCK